MNRKCFFHVSTVGAELHGVGMCNEHSEGGGNEGRALLGGGASTTVVLGCGEMCQHAVPGRRLGAMEVMESRGRAKARWSHG